MFIFLTILLTILALILVLVIALFLLKIRFLIDTEEGVFELSQRPLYRVKALTDPENPAKVKFRVFGIPFTLDFLKMSEKRKTQTRKKQKRTPKKRLKNSKKASSFSLKNFKTILNTIKVKRLAISVDTGDYTTNAQLFPIVYLLNLNVDDRYSFEINFIDENALKLQLETRPVWVSIALIKLKIKQINTNKNGS